ncbi:hypothetical protein [Streptomyces endophytica]|uniref:Uncharacterized protein n=1 Tax=Streptomyces endophytica TaxID=2991496 RepID=A0ABY6P6N5_9ACTN|nr:hypothetical protein [Streptomyces endophytica]UZJ29446.1 hypothetical protein OJ254_01800 [Streptomyces endophytica]
MYHFELELRVRQDELRREAVRQRLAREAIDGRRAARRPPPAPAATNPKGG